MVPAKLFYFKNYYMFYWLREVRLFPVYQINKTKIRVWSVTKEGFDLEQKKYIEIIYSWLSRCSTARGSFPGYPWEVPLRYRLISLFYSLKVPLKKVPLKLKIKNT